MYWWKSGPKKGQYAGAYSVRKCPTAHIQARIAELSEWVAEYDEKPWLYAEKKEHGEQALDYLFAELGRRAKRAVVS